MQFYQLGFTRPSFERQQKAVQHGYLLAHGVLPDITQLSLFAAYENTPHRSLEALPD